MLDSKLRELCNITAIERSASFINQNGSGEAQSSSGDVVQTAAQSLTPADRILSHTSCWKLAAKVRFSKREPQPRHPGSKELIINIDPQY